MKFNLNLGNLNIKQEPKDIVSYKGKEKHIHHIPGRSLDIGDFNIGLEFEMDEIIQLCKSSDITMLELMKLAKEAIPQIVEFKERAREKEIVDLKNKIYGLEAELSAARSCKEHIKGKYNELVKEVKGKPTKLADADDRELY